MPHPTDAELTLLRVLWDRGPSTVREVHEVVERANPVGYTTTLKLLQLMAEKGLVERDTAQRAHVYRPAVEREAVERRLVENLLERAFGGSAEKLVLHALSAKRVSPEELAQIRDLLNQIEKRS